MKKYLLLIPAFLPFRFQASAQEVKRCSAVEYLKARQEKDPGVSVRMQASADAMQEWIRTASGRQQQTVVSIPVVFHVLYNDSSQYLDDSVILSQLDVINEDYRRRNADSTQTPLPFRSVAADCEIAFCLAQRTPANQWTNGIVHKYTMVTAFSNFDNPKFSALGGDDAWDPARYLNIWVAAFTSSNFLGIGTFPNSVPPEYDGVVINYKACGRIGSHLMAHYDQGRSLTHEIGHWLSLVHTWGDDASDCSADDFISDTPLQASETYGCPPYPKTDICSSTFPGIMFMNFMDYTDDGCMNIFTAGQKTKMLAALTIDRASILASNGCISVGIPENDPRNYFEVYPNPVQRILVIAGQQANGIDPAISITDLTGRTVMQTGPAGTFLQQIQLDVSALPAGVYFVHINAAKGAAVYRILKQ